MRQETLAWGESGAGAAILRTLLLLRYPSPAVPLGLPFFEELSWEDGPHPGLMGRAWQVFPQFVLLQRPAVSGESQSWCLHLREEGFGTCYEHPG
jgi:hypothetical protein